MNSATIKFLLAICLSCSLSASAFIPKTSTTTYPSRTSSPLVCMQATSSSSPQLLEFVEPTTGVTVNLVGCMHYNPASIKLTQDTIRSLAAEEKLGSIIIESCTLRWNLSLESEDWIKKLLFSEMDAAHDLGMQYKRPVILGDQLINITMAELGNGFIETFKSLAQPTRGWQSLLETVQQARREAFPFGSQYISAFAFLEPKFFLATPIAFLKYPASYMVRSPVATAVLLTWLAGGDDTGAAAATATTTATANAMQLQSVDYVGDLVLSALETIVFARVFLKELLADRNDILAKNILEQCQLYQQEPRWKRWFRSTSQVPYAPDSAKNKPNETGKTIVAVVGIAHCNGIAKLLQEKRV